MKNKIDNIEFEITNGRTMLGGQSCGITYTPAILKCNDLNLEINLSYYRSLLKNRDLLHKTLEFIIKEIENEKS